MGIDRADVSGLEQSNRNPIIITLWHVAQALGALLQELTKKTK
jgi:transcriptional regulator with XRE-family HTH domain